MSAQALTQESFPLSQCLRRAALLILVLSMAACASAPPPDLTPPKRHAPDAKTTLENHY